MIQRCIPFAYFSAFFDNRQHHKVPQITRYSMFNQSPKRKAVGSNPVRCAKTPENRHFSGVLLFGFSERFANKYIRLASFLRLFFLSGLLTRGPGFDCLANKNGPFC